MVFAKTQEMVWFYAAVFICCKCNPHRYTYALLLLLWLELSEISQTAD